MRVLLSFCNNKLPQVLSFYVEVRNLIIYRSSNEIHMPSYATFLSAGHSMCLIVKKRYVTARSCVRSAHIFFLVKQIVSKFPNNKNNIVVRSRSLSR